MSQIAIIGAGAWGTGLAIVLGRRGSHRVRLWAHEQQVSEGIARGRVNQKFLPGHRIPDTVTPTNTLAEALEGAEILVSVMPSQHCRGIFEQMRPHLRQETVIVSASKGLEESSLERMTEVIMDVLEADGGWTPRVGALSGPSFALEVARGDPTAVTVASPDAELGQLVQREFSDRSFRIYTNDDVIGVELGGALKNIVAIAAGICDGLGLGHNSIAALITRGLAEMTRLVVACGPRPWRDWRAWVIWSSPAPEVFPATAELALNSAGNENCSKLSLTCTAWLPRECSPPRRRLAWRTLARLKCQLPSRFTPSCTTGSRQEMPSRN